MKAEASFLYPYHEFTISAMFTMAAQFATQNCPISDEVANDYQLCKLTVEAPNAS